MNEKITNFLHDYFIAIMCGAFAVSVFLCLLCCGKSIRDNGNGASSPRGEITAAKQQQQIITGRVEGAKSEADKLAKDLRGAEDSINRIESTIASSGDTIRDCQQIIAGVRKRGPLKTASY